MTVKVLVISHNSFSSFQNMGRTLKSLFGSFPKESIYQLYFHSSYPDVDVCNSIFRISDASLIDSVKKVRKISGEIICSEVIKPSNKLFDNKSNLYHRFKKKNKHLLLARDLLWASKLWDTDKLKEWLDGINPDVIFFAAGDTIFPYVITKTLAARYNIPIAVYFCDDYYFYRERFKSPFYSVHQSLLRKNIKEISSKADSVFYISPSMEQEYSSIVGKRGITIMTPFQSKMKNVKIVKRNYKRPLIITYTGNISINRWVTLKTLGGVLSKINEREIKAIINIYSGSSDLEILDKLNIDGAMNFEGNKSYDEIVEIVENSDILLHVESFDSRDIKRVKYSISSKIPDYLIANKPVLAVGPEEVASISYLKDNNSAFCICSQKDIPDSLEEFIDNYEKYFYLGDNAKKLALNNHMEEDISMLLKKELCRVEKSNR